MGRRAGLTGLAVRGGGTFRHFFFHASLRSVDPCNVLPCRSRISQFALTLLRHDGGKDEALESDEEAVESDEESAESEDEVESEEDSSLDDDPDVEEESEVEYSSDDPAEEDDSSEEEEAEVQSEES